MFTPSHIQFHHLCVFTSLIFPAGCNFDLDSVYHTLSGKTEMTITSGDPEPFHAQAELQYLKEYEEDPMPKSLTFDLSDPARGKSGTLTLDLDRAPSRVGRRNLLGVALKITGHPERVLPKKFWFLAGYFVVRTVREHDLPDEEDRMCRDTYPIRTSQISLSLDIMGPNGQRYTVLPTTLDLNWRWTCKEFHM